MKKLCSLGLVCLLLASVARAESGVLVDHVPDGADPEFVIGVVKRSLIGRQWQIRSADGNSVEALLNHSQVIATIRIFLSNGRLLYEGNGGRTMFVTPQGTVAQHEEKIIPKRWVSNLRRDIASVLVTVPPNR